MKNIYIYILASSSYCLQIFTINKAVVEAMSEVSCSLSTFELDVYAPIIINRDSGQDSDT